MKPISEEFSKGNFDFTYLPMADGIQWNIVGHLL